MLRELINRFRINRAQLQRGRPQVQSLGLRLAFLISSVLFALMLVTSLWLEHELTHAIQQEEIRQATLNVRTMLGSLQTLMLNGQGILAREWLERMRGEHGIIDIDVLRRDGKEAFADLATVMAVNEYLGVQRFNRLPNKPLHVSHDTHEFSKALNGEVAIDDKVHGQLTIYTPIPTNTECMACHGYDNNSLRGVLMLTLSTEASEARIDAMRFNLWAISLLLAAALAGILWGVLRYSVVAPIAKLREAIVRVSEGDRQAKLPIDSHDELGDLANMFNRMQDKLSASETRIRAVMDNVLDAIITIDERGIIESANPRVKGVFGYEPEEMIGQNISIVVPEPNAKKHDEYIQHYLATGDSDIIGKGREVKGVRKGGAIFPMEISVTDMEVEGQRRFVGIARDITERKQQIAALEYQAMHDSLTDLPNRTLLSDRIHQAILNAQREDMTLALLIMDLDRFKEINDTLGHHNGDLILQQVSWRVRNVLRESDTVARLGGDEFALLLPTATLTDATKIAKKLLASLEYPFMLEGQNLSVGSSIGIAMYPEHGEDVVTLMKRADVAMYEAKRAHLGFAVYDQQKDQHSMRNLSLTTELRKAIEQSELTLHYQPKVNLTTGKVDGVEALVRWYHPQHGLMYPNDFVPLAEQTGLINFLTLWVLKKAWQQGCDWRNSGMDISMAVNLSVRNLHDQSFFKEISSLLSQGGSLLENLRMEITETAIMSDPEQAMRTLHELNNMGIRLCIDDFGTGYSSLSYLKQLPVDELKIDKGFVIGMSDDENDAVIVRSTIELAHNIGLKVVAEGVEDRESYDILKKLGCDQVQGYYISHPMPADEFVLWLQKPPWGVNKAKSKVSTSRSL